MSTKGFTLIELLLVIGILGILFSITLVTLNISRQFATTRDVRRTVDAQVILDALSQHLIDQKSTEFTLVGSTPLSISSLSYTPKGTSTPILASVPNVDLCNLLVPKYIAAMPIDPSLELQDMSCSNYFTGYKIAIGEEGRITVSAPLSELGPIILSR